MISTQLWHALKQVSIHDPVYHRAVSPNRLRSEHSLSFPARLGLVVLVFGGFCGGIHLAPDLVWALVFGMLVIIPLLYIAFNGTLSGIGWAAAVARDINEAHVRGAYPLLSTLPKGSAGISWTLCAAALYRQGAFGSEDAERVWILRTMFALIIVMGLLVYASRPQGWDLIADASVIGLVNVGVLLVAFRADDIQSIVSSGLIGMLVPTFTHDAAETRIGTMLAFLSVQISGYLLTWIVGFVLLPPLLDRLPLPPLHLAVVLALARLALFVAIREGMNRALWVALARRFETSPDELYAALC